MKFEIRFATLLLIFSVCCSIWEYWITTSWLINTIEFIIIPLCVFFLIVALLINGIKHFKEYKLRVFLPLLLLVVVVYAGSILTELFIKMDFSLNREKRYEVVNYIKELNLNTNTKISLSDRYGNVSKANNTVDVLLDSSNKLAIKFLVKRGFLNGSIPNIYLVYTDDLYFNTLSEEKLDDHWFLQRDNN
ncbi:hypothetical protein [Chondrinema litorale]|uniref:hypothetical protein n=1 Tax=Chondrinema litorale TaxID=2994555 RepID=UPI002543D937|nr:hypothetical protein [Chondrinema litorale]UZR94597.1 hypothetical protein OQ292_02030 [Chondrinema litorale]